MSADAWLRVHDPGYGALRRAGRAALVMPSMVAICDKLIGSSTVATFAAFGSFAMLLLVDFAGPLRDRIRAQAFLGLTCALLICLGTLASRTTWIGVLGMAVVAFGVLFSGVVSSVLAGATTSLLLAFILPVTVPGPVSQIPDRVAGWGLAAAVSIVAITVLWPAAARDPIRAKAISGCRAIAQRLRAEVEFAIAAGGGDTEPAFRAAIAAADAAVTDLYTTFFQTPYRPSGLTTSARAVIRLVDDLRWCNAIVLRAQPPPHAPRPVQPLLAIKRAAAEVLDGCAEVLGAPSDPIEPLDAAVAALRAALADVERAATAALPGGREQTTATRVISALDPGFRAVEVSFVTLQIAANTSFAAAAERRGWTMRLLGRPPARFTGILTSVGERALAHLDPASTWLHNSLRGAGALALAVLVADLSGVQHGFWVAFGTLSVLRSNALATGQNTLRAVLGTTLGFVVGGALVYAIGTNTAVLWVLLPFVVLVAGVAPAAISFMAGQAAFTLVLLILFNILAPAGWQIGLVRVVDVVIGGAVSLAAGLLFWPQGAGRAMGRALADAYRECADYMSAAVRFGVGRCDPIAPPSPPPRHAARAAAAASRRLDDTFRTYLAERGAKWVPMADATRLVTGVTGLRLAADSVLDLWESDHVHDGERGSARTELVAWSARLTDWYGRLATGLERRADVPEPAPRDEDAERRLIDAVRDDLVGPDGDGATTGVRVLWTGDHIEAARRLQGTLVEPARAAIASAPAPLWSWLAR